MGKDRTQDLAARLAAWHNRHPLALRVGALDVQSIGWVVLPFRAPDRGEGPPVAAPAAAGKSLRERAMERARSGGATDGAGAAAASPQAGTGAGPSAASRRPGRRAARRWQPAFTEDFIAPLSPRQVARFALRHGTEDAPGDGLPVREVAAEGEAGAGTPARLWLLTAAIERGSRRVRVLVAPEDGRVLGPRLASGPRRAAGAAVAAVVLAVAGALGWQAWQADEVEASARRPGPEPVATSREKTPPPAALPPLRAASSEPAVAKAAASSTPGATAAHAATAASSAAVPPTRVAGTAASPPPAGTPASAVLVKARPPLRPLTQHGPLSERPQVAPTLNEAAKAAARAAVQAARDARARDAATVARAASASRGARAPTALAAAPPEVTPASSVVAEAASRPAPSPPSTPPPAVTRPSPVPASAPTRTAASDAAPGHGTAWAISTRAFRTRFECEQMLVAMRDAATRSSAASALRFDVLPAGADWRAVSWPFAERQDADRVRHALAERGLRVEVVPF